MTRLDQRLVAEGHAPSRARARALIEAGVVSVSGATATKPAAQTEGMIEIDGDPNPWVSRAGLKLDHALAVHGLVPCGEALDIGASTGGFTQVLLARGATRVHAVDVGQGQLHPRVAADPRVVEMSGLNARDLAPGMVPVPDWIVCDVSFISLEKALPAALDLARAGATLVALIKPQFETGRAALGKGGIVRDPAARLAVCTRIAGFLDRAGWTPLQPIESPITGSDGNVEYLIVAEKRR